MIDEVLYDDGHRRWVWFGRDPSRPEAVIDTNEYLITQDGRGLVVDPGGVEIYPEVVTAIVDHIPLDDLDVIVGSHQDPDIVSSLALWLDVAPEARVLVPWTWTGFLAHFARDAEFTAVPDEGTRIELGSSSDLQLVPCHYVHASGHFCLYDPTARILFSSDIGAALLPPDDERVFVEDFDAHLEHMTAFHQRWMPSNRAKNDWVNRVRTLDIDMMCPQHGAVFTGEDVQRFLEWFAALEVGQAVR